MSHPLGGGRLVARHADVQGRHTAYSMGGDGFPVVFLHGWGLAEHAYRRALKRLILQGCRVYAPSLPGFGGTAELPRRDRTIAGYARWVHEFMDHVGVRGNALVVGHSFGGAVAIRLAHDFAGSVSYLVLLNAVGGAGGGIPGSVVGRPIWQWGLQFVRDLTPVDEGVRVVRAMAEDFVPNLMRSPRTMWETGMLARGADLGEEVAELGRRGLPVLVLWGDHDRVLPIDLFDALCKAIGTEGQVVPGNHSWLLADPDAFGEVMQNVVGVAGRAGGAELEHLLASTSVPEDVVAGLLADVSPLWLMSEPARVLAGDLVLCHPPLNPGEVRAVARPLDEPGALRLTVVAHDRAGLLADTAAVLASQGLSITNASVTTWTSEGLALHALTVDAPDGFDSQRYDRLGASLRSMAAGDRPGFSFKPRGRASVRSTPQSTGRSLLSVTAPDQLGLLWAACAWLAAEGVNIEAARATTASGVADAEFIVEGQFDPGALARRLSSGSVPLWRRLPCPAAPVLRLVASAITRS